MAAAVLNRADGGLLYTIQSDGAIAFSAEIGTYSDVFHTWQPLLRHFWQHEDIQNLVEGNMGFAEEQKAERWPKMQQNNQC